MADYFRVEDGVLICYTGREDAAAVPENVHTIGEGAFKGCVSLKEGSCLPACGALRRGF